MSHKSFSPLRTQPHVDNRIEKLLKIFLKRFEEWSINVKLACLISVSLSSSWIFRHEVNGYFTNLTLSLLAAGNGHLSAVFTAK
jgi:hypothetical protein